MNAPQLRFRQIHLDFHTSEMIPGVAARFDPEEFAAVLDKARVNSVTCFARCHHGWLYYESKKFPERIHPNLKNKNLLRDQIEACHARNIRVPIYITVQADFLTAREHPEWLIISPEGKWQAGPYQDSFWRGLCVNSPYRDFLKAHTREVLETLPADGVFFDIVSPRDCSCKHCLADMRKKGINLADAAARKAFGKEMLDNWKREMTAFVRKFNRTCTIFYNAGHVGPATRPIKDAYTHFELESLPSGGWGYMHFPLSIRYARNLGLDCMGMTGKFLTFWGDFHSFKSQPALEYECFQMLAQGAKCSVGDQLHPSGKIDPVTYNLIGSVYKQVEAKEPWCAGARPLADIAILTPEEFDPSQRVHPSLAGAVQMLTEAAHQFDVIDSLSDFSPYRVLIMPDYIPAPKALAAKIEKYLAKGGALIASFESGLDEAKKDFALAALGVRKTGDGPRDAEGKLARGRATARNNFIDYIIPQGAIGRGLPGSEHAMHVRGLEIKAAKGAKVLASTVLSYFDRTWEHFCSHRQTPSSGRKGYAAIVQKGRAIYFGHPIFQQYNQNAPAWCRTMVLNALSMLLPDPLTRHDGPTSLAVTVNEQAARKRLVVHLLHYIPERRCKDMDVIAGVIPLFNVRGSVRADRRIGGVRLVPDGAALEFAQKDGRVEFTVPEIRGHQMIELRFA